MKAAAGILAGIREKAEKAGMILLFLVSVSMLLYPAVSESWNSSRRSIAAAGYEKALLKLDSLDTERIRGEAVRYNRDLYRASLEGIPADPEAGEYEELLNIAGNGIMGRLAVPAADISLPVFHGTDPEILQVGAGHLEGSSLPVGGENTHCVLSGHRGLPSAKLFTDLDRVKKGDSFTLTVLGKTLVYEVIDIITVLPEDTGELAIFPGKDYCTLVTCTPYGVNTHRLLVRGERRPLAEKWVSSGGEEGKKPVRNWFGAGGVLAALVLSLAVLVSLARK